MYMYVYKIILKLIWNYLYQTLCSKFALHVRPIYLLYVFISHSHNRINAYACRKENKNEIPKGIEMKSRDDENHVKV